jgi:hypothetical protein
MRIKDILLFETGRDGGPKSKVMGFWLVRIKSLFSVAFLRFDEGSREAFHSHAFNSISWVVRGGLREVMQDGSPDNVYVPSWKPVVTRRETFHKVYGLGKANWVLTFRGPWVDKWYEITEDGRQITLTHNRVVVE